MESTPEQVAEGLVVVRVLGRVLEKLVAANSNLAQSEQGQVTKFHALKAPAIGISQYLERIHKYASCSTECFVLALIYIDRLIQGNHFLLSELNVHRVAITSILLAAKFFDDAYYNNAYYAKVGGVLVSEMNRLEVEFLFRINFSLHVSPDLYNKYHSELSAHVVSVNPLSSFAGFVPTTGGTKTRDQDQFVSCSQKQNNVSNLNYSSQEPEYIPSAEDHNMRIGESKQFLAGIPIQITPSPPAPHAQHVDGLPNTSRDALQSTNDGISQIIWRKSASLETLGRYHHSNDKEDLYGVKSDSIMEESQSHGVSHPVCPILLQPKLRHPWARRSEPLTSCESEVRSFCNGIETTNSVERATPSYTATTHGCTQDESSMFVEHSNYSEKYPRRLPNTQPTSMIHNHNFMRYQPTSISVPNSSGYNR